MEQTIRDVARAIRKIDDGEIDALAIAGRVIDGEAFPISLDETIALAGWTLLADRLCAVAVTAEDMAALSARADVLRGCGGRLDREGRRELSKTENQIAALGDAILTKMAALRANTKEN